MRKRLNKKKFLKFKKNGKALKIMRKRFKKSSKHLIN